MSADNSFDLTVPATFRSWAPVTIRYADEDRNGHVNNSTYAVWLEVGRVALIGPFLAAGPQWLGTVLVSLKIDYLAETRFPGEVQVGGRLTSIGNRSFRSVYGIFRGDRCLATAECVNVYFDLRSRSSTVPPDEVRAIMEAELGG